MDELDSISILKSYVESIDELARWDIQLAQELSYWIIQYWIKWIEPPEDTNPFVMSPFKQIKKALEKGRNKGKCAKKDSEDEEEENQNEIKWKSNENQNEIKTESNGNKNKNKKEKENKKEKIENNLLTLSKDNVETEVSNFWNKEINELITNLKEQANSLWIAYDSTKERYFAKFILTAKEYWDFCEKIWQDRTEFAVNIMKASIHINYWKWICWWPMKIYQNYSDVYNETLKFKNKVSKNLIQSF